MNCTFFFFLLIMSFIISFQYLEEKKKKKVSQFGLIYKLYKGFFLFVIPHPFSDLFLFNFF